MNPTTSMPCLLLLFAATTLRAQQLADGYQSQTIALPTAAGNVLTLPGGHVAWFDGTDLVLSSPNVPPRTLLHFGTPVFGSFTITAGPGALLFGEGSTHGLWLVPLNGLPPTAPLATVTLDYDAVLYAPGRAIVSAKTGGFATPDNELVAVDLQTGQTQVLARLPGASGPVALSAQGDLYYATASLLFPTPPGQTTVLRFRRAVVDQALATQQVLGLAQSELVLAGLDAAGDLAFDDDGDLLFTDWWTNTVGELNDAVGTTPWRTNLVDHTGATVSAVGVQFVGANGPSVFEPFQPAAGTLWVHESAFASVSQLRSVQAARPVASCSVGNPVPTGTFALQVSHGPRGGFGLVAIGWAPALGGAPLLVPGFEQPLFWDAALHAAFATWLVPFDAAGNAQLVEHNPGITPVQSFLTQTAFVDGNGIVLGSAAPFVLQLGT
jgi:hypothetical protein